MSFYTKRLVISQGTNVYSKRGRLLKKAEWGGNEGEYAKV